MTVQQLIDKLEQIENKHLNVVVRGTDHTDWVYNNDIENVEVDDIYDEDTDDLREVVVIDGGQF